MTQPNVLRRRQRGSAVLGGAAPSPTRRESYRSTGPPVGRGVATVAGPLERAHAFEEAGTLGQRQARAQSLAEEQAAGRRDAERSRVQALRDEAAAAHEEGQAALSSEFDAGVPAGQQTWDSSFNSPMVGVALLRDSMPTAFGDALTERLPDGLTQSEYDYLFPVASGPSMTGSREPNQSLWNADFWDIGDLRSALSLIHFLDPSSSPLGRTPWARGPGVRSLVSSAMGAPVTLATEQDRTFWRSGLGWALSSEAGAAVEGWKAGGGAGVDLYNWVTDIDRKQTGPAGAWIGGVSGNTNSNDPNWWGDVRASPKNSTPIMNMFGWVDTSTRRIMSPGLSQAWTLGQENLPGIRPIVGGYEAEEYLPPGLSSEEAALGITP